MKIGIINDYRMIQSLNYLFSGVEEVLKKYETLRRPPECLHASKIRREEMTRELILNSDIVVGTMDKTFLETRERVGKHVPYVYFQFANATRGFPDMRSHHKYFKSTDIIVSHCEAELEVTKNFFTNAQVRSVPIAYDESVFFQLDDAQRQTAKLQMGFRPSDKILLHVGRISMEKNLQTVLKVFSVLERLIPNLHLVAVGEPFEQPFTEFGSYPVNLRATTTKMYRALGIPEEKLHIIDLMDPAGLQRLYNISDAVVNLTLNHDENFGLAQVEAMACGTPVIGTNWGGLKETIVDGETGYKVSTVVTSALGTKVDWWEATQKIAALLNAKDSERRRLGANGRKHVTEKYSSRPFDQIVESLLAEAMELKESKTESLALSRFGREYFEICQPLRGKFPFYKQNEDTYAVYRKMIAPYAGTMQDQIEALAPEHTVCLASPVTINEDGSISIDDLICPFQLTVPEVYQETTFATLEAMREEPVIKVERLTNVYLTRQANALDTLSWMVDVGLILKTQGESEHVGYRDAGIKQSTPVYSIQRIDSTTTDLVVLG
jgi:glycosyltransferase involved in cell wall biosynthesis